MRVGHGPTVALRADLSISAISPNAWPGPRLPTSLSVDADAHLAGLDHDERLAALALLGDRLAGPVGAFEELTREPLEEPVRCAR